MDILNIQPDALGVSDTTPEIEGYDDRIEEIEQAYPEEDFRTPTEKAAQEQANQQQQPQGEQQPQQTTSSTEEEPTQQPQPEEEGNALKTTAEAA